MDTHGYTFPNLHVSDVMQSQVVGIPIHATMAEAASLLCKNDVSGAPVVDEFGRCVGVLSASDFTRRDQDDHASDMLPHRDSEFVMCQDQFRGPMQIHYVPEDSVERYMTTSTQTIDAQETLLEAARYMTEGHVSRLIVLDADAKPVGIVSSLDLLASWVSESTS